MDDAAPAALAAAIHAAPERGVLAVAGGGAKLLAALLSVPGASATVLEAAVPYARQSLADYLRYSPARACSAETARALAMRALLRAFALGGDFGFALAASLATNRPKRGTHRFHAAFQSAAETRLWTVDLGPGDALGTARRLADEDRIAVFGLRALASAIGAGAEPAPCAAAAGIPALAELLRGERPHTAAERVRAVLPGAFNPLHDGHRAMREDAARRLGANVLFELSIENVDKPPLDHLDAQARLAQFAPHDAVVTNAPTFAAKARALGGGIAFVVGVDTIRRIAEPRYYGSVAARDAALAHLARLDCTFLVYGRAEGGRFETLADIRLPQALAQLCDGVPASAFRCDLSSTALRQSGGSAGR